jgi:dipeptidyl aminopeptidase/acylaminoacyl peptidase
MIVRALLCLVLLACAAAVSAREPPPTIEQLRHETFTTSLEFERALDPGPGFRAYLVSYRSAGLKVHALVAVPDGEAPPQGYPVIVANHGTHPDPPRYGFTAEGVDSRPGDYYRSVPALFTAHGFMVVMPDYRGHNSSEGGEYARGFLASSYFAEDVLALLSALPSLEHADTGNVFMWGHSLGGEVTLKALLATDRVRGASLWSAVGGDIWEQAYYYSTRNADDLADGSGVAKDAVVALRGELDALGPAYDWRDSNALRFLACLHAPVILHHALEDRGALYDWSRRLAAELYALGKVYEFHSYPGSDHFFEGETRLRAAERDARFFRGLMSADR